MNKFKQLISFFPFLLLIIIASCSKEELPNIQQVDSTTAPTNKYEGILKKYGFDVETIVENGDQIIVEGDLFFSKRTLDELIDNGQRAITSAFAVSDANINDIAVFIAPGFDANQRQLVRDAMNNWENIPNSAINFREVRQHNQANLTIAPDNWGMLPTQMQGLAQNATGCGGAHGVAWFANNNVVGRFVSINTDLAIRAGNAQFRLTVEHEVGHTIGFAHGNQGGFTNYNAFDENGQGGTHTASTLSCTLSNQTNNLMEGNVACNLHNLSNDERLAAEFLYPEDFGTLYVSSSPLGFASFYEFTFSHSGGRHHSSEITRFNASTNAQVHNQQYTCGTSVPFQVPTGTWDLRFVVRNFRGDVTATRWLYNFTGGGF